MRKSPIFLYTKMKIKTTLFKSIMLLKVNLGKSSVPWGWRRDTTHSAAKGSCCFSPGLGSTRVRTLVGPTGSLLSYHLPSVPCPPLRRNPPLHLLPHHLQPGAKHLPQQLFLQDPRKPAQNQVKSHSRSYHGDRKACPSVCSRRVWS